MHLRVENERTYWASRFLHASCHLKFITCEQRKAPPATPNFHFPGFEDSCTVQRLIFQFVTTGLSGLNTNPGVIEEGSNFFAQYTVINHSSSARNAHSHPIDMRLNTCYRPVICSLSLRQMSPISNYTHLCWSWQPLSLSYTRFILYIPPNECIFNWHMDGVYMALRDPSNYHLFMNMMTSFRP